MATLQDPVAADALVAMCYAAACSVRQESLLRPFPPAFVDSSGAKDVNGLCAALAAVPPLSAPSLQAQPLQQVQLQLLQWLLRLNGPVIASQPANVASLVFCQIFIYSLKTPWLGSSTTIHNVHLALSPSHNCLTFLFFLCIMAFFFSFIKTVQYGDVLTQHRLARPPGKPPTHVLTLTYPDEMAAGPLAAAAPASLSSTPTSSRQSFAQLKALHGTDIAFHGTALENFHSIVRSGFCGNLNKCVLVSDKAEREKTKSGVELCAHLQNSSCLSHVDLAEPRCMGQAPTCPAI